MNIKVNFLHSVSIGRVCDVRSYNKCSNSSLSALTQAHSFIAMSITRCSKSVQKFAVWVPQVTAVAMATMQLVLNNFKNFLSYEFRIE